MIKYYRQCISGIKQSFIFLMLASVATPSLYALDYPEKGDFARGSKIWSENCARCHNMRNPTDLKDGLTSLFHMRVRAGLTGQETRDVITFLRGVNSYSMNGSKSSARTAVHVVEDQATRSGKQLYESNCMACHGPHGKGSITGVPDFTDRNGRLAKSHGELLGNIINGYQSPGSLMPMPPRGGNSQLTDADLNAALKYIKASFFE